MVCGRQTSPGNSVGDRLPGNRVAGPESFPLSGSLFFAFLCDVCESQFLRRASGILPGWTHVTK